MDSNHSVDQGQFEAMKTLSGRRALRCDKHQFCPTMMVSTYAVCEILLLGCETTVYIVGPIPVEG